MFCVCLTTAGEPWQNRKYKSRKCSLLCSVFCSTTGNDFRSIHWERPKMLFYFYFVFVYSVFRPTIWNDLLRTVRIDFFGPNECVVCSLCRSQGQDFWIFGLFLDFWIFGFLIFDCFVFGNLKFGSEIPRSPGRRRIKKKRRKKRWTRCTSSLPTSRTAEPTFKG